MQPPHQAQSRATVFVRGTLVEVEASDEARLIEGDGVRLDFRNAHGFACHIFGVLRFLAETADGVRFRVKVVHCSSLETGLESGEVPSQVSLLFRVAMDGAGIRLGFHARMSVMHTQAFLSEVQRVAGRYHNQILLIFIDASAVRTSPQDALEYLHRAFSTLTRSTMTIGVLLGSHSTGMSQLVRILREAEVADSLVRVDNPDEAETVWGTISRELNEAGYL